MKEAESLVCLVSGSSVGLHVGVIPEVGVIVSVRTQGWVQVVEVDIPRICQVRKVVHGTIGTAMLTADVQALHGINWDLLITCHQKLKFHVFNENRDGQKVCK